MRRRGFLRMIIGLIACLACWHSLQAKVGREFVASDIRESMQKGDKLAITFSLPLPINEFQSMNGRKCSVGFSR